MTRRRGNARLVRTALLRLGVCTLGVVAPACGSPGGEAPRPQLEAQPSAQAAERPMLADITNQSPPVRVQVLSAQRVAEDTIRLELMVSNLAATTATPEETAALSEAWVAFGRVSIVTADGRRRTFPLHDSAGRMDWSGLEPPATGQKRQVWMRFPAPAREMGHITLIIPGLLPLRDIPVAP